MFDYGKKVTLLRSKFRELAIAAVIQAASKTKPIHGAQQSRNGTEFQRTYSLANEAGARDQMSTSKPKQSQDAEHLNLQENTSGDKAHHSLFVGENQRPEEHDAQKERSNSIIRENEMITEVDVQENFRKLASMNDLKTSRRRTSNDAYLKWAIETRGKEESFHLNQPQEVKEAIQKV